MTMDDPSSRRRAFHVATLLVVGLVVWLVTSTYTVLSHTVDEPVHIAAGLEWLQRGTQQLHPENPPLSRVAVGLGAYLAGHRVGLEGRAPLLGTEVLYTDGTYRSNLIRARLGTLPFFLLTVVLVWLWTLRVGGERVCGTPTVQSNPQPKDQNECNENFIVFVHQRLPRLVSLRWSVIQPSLKTALRGQRPPGWCGTRGSANLNR